MTVGQFLLLVLVGVIAAAALQLLWLYGVLGLAVVAVALKLWFNR